MRILSVVCAGALALAFTSAGGSTIGMREQVFTCRHENVLGTSLDLKFVALSRAQADRAEGAVLREISRQSNILSSWSRDSEFSRWARTHDEAVTVSAELLKC